MYVREKRYVPVAKKQSTNIDYASRVIKTQQYKYGGSKQ